MCRSRRELSNAYLLAKFGFDTAENEPFQVCPLSAYRCPRYENSSTGLKRWAYDQIGFNETMIPLKFKRQISVLQSGCPVNSPWADFVVHLVGGTVGVEYYDPKSRAHILREARKCISSILQSASVNLYGRCALCDMIGERISIWKWRNGERKEVLPFSVSCPNVSESQRIR